MGAKYTFIGPGDLYIDHVGRQFEKQASAFVPLMNKYIEAEERYVQKQIEERDDPNE